MQKPMIVPPTMEDVNRCVIIPLVASTAAVGQATCCMGMDSIAVVSNNLALDDMSYHGCTTLHADINECENGDDN